VRLSWYLSDKKQNRMAKNWAIAIGINQYNYLQPLNYAKRDAELIQDFLYKEAGFEQVILFSDDSPDYKYDSTRPIRANLRRVLLDLPVFLRTKCGMGAGDNFWFFFSGHGMRHDGRDYLMSSDGNPRDIVDTAISINFVTEKLRLCGADNVVLILDACRNEGQRSGQGIGTQTAAEARQKGVISIFSCSPKEYSYEIPALQQGAFTTALLEGFRDRHTTAVSLNQYLQRRVSEIVSFHSKAEQTPYIIAEPVTKSHLILVPQYANPSDVTTLKEDAYEAEVNRNWDLAEQLWFRVLDADSDQSMKVIDAIKRIERERLRGERPDTPGNVGKGVSTVEPPVPTVPTFQFEVVTVNAQGKITNRRNEEARYFAEDLGNGVTLDMVQIPGGTFTMGSPESEKDRSSDESPQHQVTVPGFFMGKYEITQEQYQAIMGTNPSNFKGEKRPVEKVSWNDAVEFCEKLSQKTGRTYRLPSEAEWEYACRAGTTTPFYFGETITPDLVNYHGNYPYGSAPKGKYREETTNVGIFPPNSFGLYDMCGNIWEWCEDVYNDSYEGAPIDGSAWLTGSDNNKKLLRGGGWNYNAWFCRSAYRNRYARAYRILNVGFRVVAVAVA
jgi:formylglycine-generating enzyme required for sulfatase activity/uncharacterized caspase-like protein